MVSEMRDHTWEGHNLSPRVPYLLHAGLDLTLRAAVTNDSAGLLGDDNLGMGRRDRQSDHNQD